MSIYGHFIKLARREMDPEARARRVLNRLASVRKKAQQTNDGKDRAAYMRSMVRLHQSASKYVSKTLEDKTVPNSARAGQAFAGMQAQYKQNAGRQALKRGAMIGAGIGAVGAGYMAYKAYKANKAKKEQAAQTETPKIQ